MYRSEDILNQLDKCNREYTFPMLDGLSYPATTRLTAYRDDKRWVIIIEAIGFNYRGGGHTGINNCLYIYGNCLNYTFGLENKNILYPTDNSSSCNTFDEEEYFYLNPESSTFLLRGETIPVIHEREKYLQVGINLEDEQKINAFEFLRLLNELYYDKLVATDNEIQERIPSDIHKILELREWFHPDIVGNELPSQNETFQQIAKVLETGNIDFYQPTKKPNTHWKNWPEGGTL